LPSIPQKLIFPTGIPDWEGKKDLGEQKKNVRTEEDIGTFPSQETQKQESSRKSPKSRSTIGDTDGK